MEAESPSSWKELHCGRHIPFLVGAQVGLCSTPACSHTHSVLAFARLYFLSEFPLVFLCYTVTSFSKLVSKIMIFNNGLLFC